MTAFLRKTAAAIAPPLIVFALVVLLWHVLVLVFEPKPFIVPGPARVLAAARENGATLLMAMSLTGGAALLGLAISFVVGSVVAFIFAQSAVIQRGFYPYAIFLQTVPIVAVAPLIILWFGQDFRSVVLVAFILSLFPIVTNGTTGLTEVDRNHLELFEINNASRWQVLLKLRWPNSVPYMVTGVKISSGLSVIGAIIGEFFAGFGQKRFGLGYLIQYTSGQLKTDYLFAAILASTLLGLSIFGVVSLIGRAIVSRYREA